MRNFLSYLNRRGVTDESARLKWTSRNKLSTIKDVELFCVSRDLRISQEDMQKAFPFLIKKKDSAPAALKQDSSKEENKSWHVPAAERPLGRAHATPDTKPRRKKRVRKASVTKVEK